MILDLQMILDLLMILDLQIILDLQLILDLHKILDLQMILCLLQVVPVDDDEVCQICKDMVGQARDTLQSNETQVFSP
jgi:hypothetical protein